MVYNNLLNPQRTNSDVEDIKIKSDYLRGSLTETLADRITGLFQRTTTV